MTTAFDRYFNARMKKPTFAKAYAKARAEIDSFDMLIRILDHARAAEKLSKAELARRIKMHPVAVRRLFTNRSANPSFETVSKLVGAVGLRLVIEPATKRPARRAPSGAQGGRPAEVR